MLKCLSEMGLEHLNAGFLLHVLNEQSEHSLLNSTALRSSMDRWWINCIRNEKERVWLNHVVTSVRCADLRFEREMYEEVLKARESTGFLSLPNVDEECNPS
jgi:hypothetical protein